MDLQQWRPQIGPQAAAIDAALIAEELLFGGARGGGKTDFLLADFIADIGAGYGADWRGVIFRKTYPECEELIARSREMYPACYSGAEFHQQSKTWRFPDGGTLKIRALENQYDADKFQGHSYTWIGWDELGNWPNAHAYHKLKACLRSAAPIAAKRIRATANPGGVGHHWIKTYFAIDRYPQGSRLIKDDTDSGTRLFIKSRVFDNKILLAQDPNYILRLQKVGGKDLVRAWLDGNWDVIAGSFFPEWDNDVHVIAPFRVPDAWLRFLSFDWGSSSPFSAGWWAVAGEDYALDHKRILPRSALVRYREWYGADVQGYGLKLSAEQVASGILSRMPGAEKLAYAVADPSIFRVDGGPSIAERMGKNGLQFRAADNARIAGWDQMRARLKGEDKAMMYCFDTCIDSIRTIPALEHARHMPEDIDARGEDHAADEWRYACMSRPYVRQQLDSKRLPILEPVTWNDLHELDLKTRSALPKRI